MPPNGWRYGYVCLPYHYQFTTNFQRYINYTTCYGFVLYFRLLTLKINIMHHYDVKRFALVLAIQAEIEGMKAENTQRDQMNYSLAYTDADFQAKAEELRVLANLHDEQI